MVASTAASDGQDSTFVETTDGSSLTTVPENVNQLREVTLRPFRVFINHVDGYHTRKLIDVLIDRNYVPPVPEADGDEQENENGQKKEEEPPPPPQEPPPSPPQQGSPRISHVGIKRYDIIGTVQNEQVKFIEGVRIIPPAREDKEKFMNEILKCGFVIFDVTQKSSQVDETLWTLNEILLYLEEFERTKPRAFALNRERRHFILISSVLTWARTKPLEDPEEPMLESYYRKRKAHDNFRELIHCERVVFGAMHKRPQLGTKLSTAVVCAGVTYGEGEDLLEYAFKLGWLNESELPVVFAGDNLVPLVHVRDLAAAVFTIMREWPQLPYVVAVENKLSTQTQIIKAISRVLTTGKVKHILKDDAMAIPDVLTRSIDAITLNLRLQPDFLARSRHMVWLSEGGGFVENIERIVKEFRAARSLYPLRLIVLGPPASGKSLIARQLAKQYRLPYIGLKKLIQETIQQLRTTIEDAKRNAEAEAAEEEEENAEETNTESLLNQEELLNEIETSLVENNDRLSDVTLTKIYRFKLLSKPCRNQGYVLDGYPKTGNQAVLLFTSSGGGGEQDKEDEGEGEGETTNAREDELTAILPDMVIGIDAGDEFLLKRIADLAEKELKSSRYSEDNMTMRLLYYRERNGEDNSPLQLFDELEIHPIILNVEDDASPTMISTFEYCLSVIGDTHGYGKTGDELAEERRQAAELEAARAARDAAENERIEAEIKAKRELKAEQWAALVERFKIEEEERLHLTAEPLRHYLMKYMFPVLTQGLVKVAKLRPDDPIDYLAEYLMKENPEARMFEPDYTEAVSSTLSSLKVFQCEGFLPALESLGDESYEFTKASEDTLTTPNEDDDLTCWCSSDMSREAEECPTPPFSFSKDDIYALFQQNDINLAQIFLMNPDDTDANKNITETPASPVFSRKSSIKDPRLAGGAQSPVMTAIVADPVMSNDEGSKGGSTHSTTFFKSHSSFPEVDVHQNSKPHKCDKTTSKSEVILSLSQSVAGTNVSDTRSKSEQILDFCSTTVDTTTSNASGLSENYVDNTDELQQNDEPIAESVKSIGSPAESIVKSVCINFDEKSKSPFQQRSDISFMIQQNQPTPKWMEYCSTTDSTSGSTGRSNSPASSSKASCVGSNKERSEVSLVIDQNQPAKFEQKIIDNMKSMQELIDNMYPDTDLKQTEHQEKSGTEDARLIEISKDRTKASDAGSIAGSTRKSITSKASRIQDDHQIIEKEKSDIITRSRESIKSSSSTVLNHAADCPVEDVQRPETRASNSEYISKADDSMATSQISCGGSSSTKLADGGNQIFEVSTTSCAEITMKGSADSTVCLSGAKSTTGRIEDADNTTLGDNANTGNTAESTDYCALTNHVTDLDLNTRSGTRESTIPCTRPLSPKSRVLSLVNSMFNEYT